MVNKSREREKCKANLYVFQVKISELCSTKRIQEHVSINEIARSIGVTDRNLRKYAQGECVPRADVLVAIAKYFNVSLDWLMGINEIVTYKSNE